MNKKKITLSRTTIRKLTDSEMENVAGGWTMPGQSCWCLPHERDTHGVCTPTHDYPACATNESCIFCQ